MEAIKKTSTLVALTILLSGIGLLFAPVSSFAFQMHFRESGVGNFNSFLAASHAPDFPIFWSPGVSDFRDHDYNPVADWTGTWTSLFLVSASGTTRDELIFALTFDVVSYPFSFDFWAFEDSRLRDWTTYSYNGQGMVDYNYDNWTFNVHPVEVPEPTTLLLFGGGLAGLIGFVRRSRSAKRS